MTVLINNRREMKGYADRGRQSKKCRRDDNEIKRLERGSLWQWTATKGINISVVAPRWDGHVPARRNTPAC